MEFSCCDIMLTAARIKHSSGSVSLRTPCQITPLVHPPLLLLLMKSGRKTKERQRSVLVLGRFLCCLGHHLVQGGTMSGDMTSKTHSAVKIVMSLFQRRAKSLSETRLPKLGSRCFSGASFGFRSFNFGGQISLNEMRWWANFT